jgi:WD40 repeat protein
MRCPHCFHSIAQSAAGVGELLCPACGSSFRIENPQLTSTLAQVQLAGKFQLLERVGQGAFGIVWKARDTELDHIVALKIPHAGLLSQPGYIERFLREARAAARLHHPGIVRLYEVATIDDVSVLVSRFIAGAPLKEVMEVRRLTFRESAALVADVADALDYAHRQGVWHRDIKPGNIMIESNAGAGIGQPIVVDFGLALRGEAEVVMTVEGQVLGTPAYMSPEQALGHGHHVDGRSDVYSLGVVLYQLLTNELPFRGSKQMIIHQVLHEEPRAPRKINDKIPRDLETITQRAMAKEPGRRYQTAEGLAMDLRRWLKNEPIEARPVGRPERAWRWCRRNPALAGATAMAAFALGSAAILGIGLLISQAHSLNQSRMQATSLALDRGLEQCQKDHVDEGLLWFARSLRLCPTSARDLDEAARLNLSGWERSVCPLRAFLPAAAAIRTAAFAPHDKIAAIAARDLVSFWDLNTKNRVRDPIVASSPILALAWSPDGRTLATGGDNGAVQLWSPLTPGSSTLLVDQPNQIVALAWKPDGQVLASGGSEGKVRQFAVATGKESGPILAHPGTVTALAWSPDGKVLWSACKDGLCRRWDLDAAKVSLTLKHEQRIEALALSEDGKSVLTAGEDHTARVWNAEDGRLLQTLAHPASVRAAALSPDGKLALTGGDDHAVRIWDVATGRPAAAPYWHSQSVLTVAWNKDGHLLLSGGDRVGQLRELCAGTSARAILAHEHHVASVVYSPDGQVLLTTTKSDDGKAGEARLWSLSGVPLCEPLRHQGMVLRARFSTDGSRVATAAADHLVRLFACPGGMQLRQPLEHPDTVRDLDWHPDGYTLLTGCKDGSARLWDTATGAIVDSFAHGRPLQVVAWHPDGKRFVTAADDGTVQLWDWTARRILRSFQHSALVRAASFTRDGNTLVTASFDTTARVWNTNTGDAIGDPFWHQDKVYALALSADGRYALTGSADRTARLWDLIASHPTNPWAHDSRINAVAFRDDSRVASSAGEDQSIRLWHVASRRPLGPTLYHNEGVLDVAFQPGGAGMASGARDQTARLWEVPAPMDGTPEELELRVRVLTGLDLDDRDAVHWIDPTTWLAMAKNFYGG